MTAPDRTRGRFSRLASHPAAAALLPCWTAFASGVWAGRGGWWVAGAVVLAVVAVSSAWGTARSEAWWRRAAYDRLANMTTMASVRSIPPGRSAVGTVDGEPWAGTVDEAQVAVWLHEGADVRIELVDG